jgi:hypothetical protein
MRCCKLITRGFTRGINIAIDPDPDGRYARYARRPEYVGLTETSPELLCCLLQKIKNNQQSGHYVPVRSLHQLYRVRDDL